MAKAKPAAKPAPKEEPVERETYTAKQIATRCGTDAKTMRKFFRSSKSTVEPVGQGGRYEFDSADLPKIKAEFDAWKSGSTVKGTPGSKNALPKSSRGKSKPAPVEEIEDDDEELDMEDLDPTEDELDDLEDEDLSLDDEEED